MAASTTKTTTGDTTITDPVSVQVFGAPVPEHLDNEALRVVFAHTMAKNPGQSLYPLTEAVGLVVGSVLAHFMVEATV